MIIAQMTKYIRSGALVCSLTAIAVSQGTEASQVPGKSLALRVCASCVHAHMNFLASDALRGRGSGTADEWVAATYVASQLEEYGVAPAGDDSTYLQRAT